MTVGRGHDREPEAEAEAGYGAYAAAAALRFDLDGRTETNRQHQARVSFCEAIGEHTMSEQLRGILKRARASELDPKTALSRRATHGVNTP